VSFRNLVLVCLLMAGVAWIAVVKFDGSPDSTSTETTTTSDADPKQNTEAAGGEASSEQAEVKPTDMASPDQNETVKTKDLTMGATKLATEGSRITYNVVIKLMDGKVVFDSYKDKPWTGTLGNGSILTGLDKGIRGMYQGGKRAIWIPSYLAYGPFGIRPHIPPHAKLYAEVELLSVF
jgi:FKBP-type peptidyl-prolyl cis-trans isomerase